MTCRIADPTRPAPPVTRMTDWVCLIDMTAETLKGGEWNALFGKFGYHGDFPFPLNTVLKFDQKRS